MFVKAMFLKMVKKITLRCLTALFLCSAFLTPCLAFDAKREVTASGLAVIHSERNTLPIVRIALLIPASPLDEMPEKAGLAHLTAEMLMEGTSSRNSRQISEEVEFMGAGLAVAVQHDFTTLSLSILKKDLEKGFDIFADVLLNPVFSETEMAHKKEIITGSIKQQEESPDYVASKAFAAELFGLHPYGRPVEGFPQEIKGLTREDLLAFHREYYVPEGSILSVVGNVSYEELKGLIAKYLDKWQAKRSRPRTNKEEYATSSSRVKTIDRKLTQANIILGNAGITRDNPGYYAVSVMNYILGGGGFASRLMQTVRDDMGLAYDIHSLFTALKYAGTFQVVVQTKKDHTAGVIKEIVKQIERVRQKEVSDQELVDAKAFLTGSFPRKLDTMDKIATFLALAEFYGLGLDYDTKYPRYIEKVTREDIKAVADKYLKPKDYLLVIVGNMKTIKLDGKKSSASKQEESRQKKR